LEWTSLHYESGVLHGNITIDPQCEQ